MFHQQGSKGECAMCLYQLLCGGGNKKNRGKWKMENAGKRLEGMEERQLLFTTAVFLRGGTGEWGGETRKIREKKGREIKCRGL